MGCLFDNNAVSTMYSHAKMNGTPTSPHSWHGQGTVPPIVYFLGHTLTTMTHQSFALVLFDLVSLSTLCISTCNVPILCYIFSLQFADHLLALVLCAANEQSRSRSGSDPMGVKTDFSYHSTLCSRIFNLRIIILFQMKFSCMNKSFSGSLCIANCVIM